MLVVILCGLLGSGGFQWSRAEAGPFTEGDTAAIDTMRLLSDRPLKSPMGALLRSAVIPGWGQFYNEQYAKGVLVLGVNAVLIQRVFYYHNQWRKTRNRAFQDKRNTFTWYWGLAYILTLVDAYVDAYLFEFDTAMEISGRYWPSGDGGWAVPGVQLVIRF